MNTIVYRKTAMLPLDETGGQFGVDELFLQEELDDYPTEILRYSVEVAKKDMQEPVGLIEASFQHDGVPMGIPSKKLTRRLIGQNHSRPDWPLGRLVVELLNDREKDTADIRKQPSVVAEVGPQDTRYRTNELFVGLVQEELYIHIFGEQQGPFLRTGRAKVESFTAEWP